ncbi:MAG: hypothetical protein IT375_27730 [Polyangiaceae bacterium]|nr:hypothetical protein [Polyangiaceae bacterium]
MKTVIGAVGLLSVAGFVVAACSGGGSGGGGGGSGATAGIDGGGMGGGGTSAGGNAGTGAGGSGGGTVECASDGDCAAKMPATNPTDCAEAKCDLVLKKCNFVAKDADGDGHAAAKCAAVGGGSVAAGDDCDDGDVQSYPGAWDGPADPGSGKSDACDSKDNDCDGTSDNQKVGGKSCACDPLDLAPCAETATGSAIPGLDSAKDGVGICKLGKRECNAGVPGKCNGAVGPSTELCSDATTDEDCDGNPKNGCVCVAGEKTTCNAGQCNTAQVDCNASTGKFPTCPAPVAKVEYCPDGDGDAHCTTSCQLACSAPGSTWKSSCPKDDCDDKKNFAYPGAKETCGDGVDANCTAGDSDGFDVGASCTAGTYGTACYRSGTKVCAGTSVTTCSATAATPQDTWHSAAYVSGTYSSWDWNCNGTVQPRYLAVPGNFCGAYTDVATCLNGDAGYEPNYHAAVPAWAPAGPHCGENISRFKCLWGGSPTPMCIGYPSGPTTVVQECK